MILKDKKWPRSVTKGRKGIPGPKIPGWGDRVIPAHKELSGEVA